MQVHIRQIDDKSKECLIIECVELTADIESIRAYALTKGVTLTGENGGKTYRFNLSDVLYFEAFGEQVFAYTTSRPYELKQRLYVLESAYADNHFVRCSKAFVINLMKLECISPALNGRFTAHMKSGEKIIISRQYVPQIKRVVLGGKSNGL